MGTHGVCARVRDGTLAGGRGRRRVIVPFVVSIGLLPALAGCSSFSSSPSSSDSASSGSLGAAVPVSARGAVNINPAPSGPATEDTGPSGLLVNLFRSNSTPPAPPSNMPHPPSTYTASAPPYTPSSQTVAMPSPPSAYASSASLGVAGPASARGAVNINPAASSPATENTGPSGLLVNLFRFNSTPPAPPSNMPHPPSTYTASAPPYTPPLGQAVAPPPASSAQ